jgi:DNA-directed RNA polymerase subunit RPC12/RpoP
MKNEEIRCPYCHSDNVRRNGYSGMAFAIGMLLIGLPFIFRSRKYFCFDCSRTFKPGKTISASNPEAEETNETS